MTLESKNFSFMMSKGTSVRSEPWNGSSDFLEAGFSWPPRSYSCSFCHREFRSAQALGGHMNVHRRDRARLRVQSPPPIINSTTFLNLTTTNPNPNPSLLPSAPSSPNSSSKSSTFTLLSQPAAISTYSATAAASTIKDIEKRQRVDHDDSSCGGGGYSKVVKTTGSEINVGLDLEIGLLGGPAASHDQDLDLELRLGCF